jgi:hypothetical protein
MTIDVKLIIKVKICKTWKSLDEEQSKETSIGRELINKS